jgi:hypothetical protein
VADNKPEGDEYFDLELNTASGATISDATGRVTITENSIVISDAARMKTGNATELDKPGSYFKVNVASNPANIQFRLQVESSAKEKILIQISDAQGRVIERIESKMSSQSIYLGNRYRPGIYFATITQGNNSKTVKLVKL